MPLRLRVVTGIGLVLVALFMLSTLAYNAPDSPASIRVSGLLQSYMVPYFDQDWQLFGPTPGTTNPSLILRIRAANCTRQPLDIEYAIDRLPRQNRLLPSKLPGVTLAFQEEFRQYAQYLRSAEHKPARVRQRLLHGLRRLYGDNLKELQRFLSLEARVNDPGCKVSAVQSVFADTAITPFSERDERPAPKEPLKAIFQTPWLPYVSGVDN